jgi:cyclophilin family peptidyl-prolyl cis-trans isomerase
VPPYFWTRNATGFQATGAARLVPKGFGRPVHLSAVPCADRRHRKKENARLARAAREAAAKRRRLLRNLRNAAIVVVLFVGFAVLINVLTGDDDQTDSAASTTTLATAPPTTVGVSAPDFEVDPAKTYEATITTNFGDIVLALDTKRAPVGAGHFIKLARDGAYDGSRWHRIVKDFVIQGGAPKGDSSADGPSSLVAEVPADHYPVGSLAAAKTQLDPPGTFEAQFFIVTGEAQGRSLPNDYARFGSVKSGMDVVRRIEALETEPSQEPTEKATIDKVTITES